MAIVLLTACSTADLGPLRANEPCFIGFVDDKLLEQELQDGVECCSGGLTTATALRLSELRSDAWVPGLGQPESPAQSFALAIGRSAAVHRFAEGKSRFLLIDLSGLPMAVASVRVVPGRSGLTAVGDECADARKGESRYLMPIVTFLDSDRRLLGPAVAGEFDRVGASVAIRFAVPKAARYAAIHSDPRRYGERLMVRGESRVEWSAVVTSGVLLPVPQHFSGSINGYARSTGVLHLVLGDTAGPGGR